LKHFRILIIFIAAAFVFVPLMSMGAKTAQKPPAMFSKSCLNCHSEYKEMKNTLAGNFKSRSGKAKSIQVKINNRMVLVKYTPETKVKNVPKIKSLKGTIPLRVHYKKVGNDLVATEIVAKPKITVPDEQLMEVKELTELVAQGPEKGNYLLVDSRPPIKFNEGYIPGAVSIPFSKMKSMTDKLPQDKDKMIIFYCEGFR
jgi:hypothetical protein